MLDTLLFLDAGHTYLKVAALLQVAEEAESDSHSTV